MAVLGIIILLSALLVLFMEEATAKIRYYGLFYNRDDLRVQAYSMLEVTLAVIDEVSEVDGGIFAGPQGWGNPLQYAGLEPPDGLDVSIRVEDESAKFPLSALDVTLLNILFEEMGIHLVEAEILTDSLLDWMDADDNTRLNGAETDFYERKPEPYQAADRNLESWDELRLIRGFDELFYDEDGLPTPLLAQFRSAVSLYHDGRVNANTAGGLVLTVLERMQGFESDYLTSYLAGDDFERGTADDNLVTSLNNPYLTVDTRSGNLLDVRTDVLRVAVRVSRGEANFLINAVVRRTGANPSASRSTGESAAADNPVRRGGTARRSDSGASLGYPFEIVRITENFRF